MTGYTSIKEYIQDYELIELSKEIGTIRTGMDLEKLMKKRLKDKFRNRSEKFKRELKKNNYSEFDLKLISINKSNYESFENIYQKIFGSETIKIEKIKQIIESEAFKQGKLYNIYKFIPEKIDSTRKLKSFLKNWNRGITESEINMILKLINDNNAKKWLNKILETEYHHKHAGRYFI